jgi:hypothetical protein
MCAKGLVQIGAEGDDGLAITGRIHCLQHGHPLPTTPGIVVGILFLVPPGIWPNVKTLNQIMLLHAKLAKHRRSPVNIHLIGKSNSCECGMS